MYTNTISLFSSDRGRGTLSPDRREGSMWMERVLEEAGSTFRGKAIAADGIAVKTEEKHKSEMLEGRG